MHLRAIGRQFTQMSAYFLVMNSKRCSCNLVRMSLNGIPRRLASALSSIRACILGLNTSPFIAAFSELICLLHYVQEWAVGREHLQLGIGGGDGGISICWRIVVIEDNLLVGV